MLAYLLDRRSHSRTIDHVSDSIERLGHYTLEVPVLEMLEVIHPVVVFASEYQEALSYLEDNEA